MYTDVDLQLYKAIQECLKQQQTEETFKIYLEMLNSLTKMYGYSPSGEKNGNTNLRSIR